jgi:U3 small nucleolar RNA-associated protein 21
MTPVSRRYVGAIGEEANAMDVFSDLEGITAVGEPEYQDIYTTPDQLAEDMMTLSLVPRSKWQTLLNLDTIRVRFCAV